MHNTFTNLQRAYKTNSIRMLTTTAGIGIHKLLQPFPRGLRAAAPTILGGLRPSRAPLAAGGPRQSMRNLPLRRQISTTIWTQSPRGNTGEWERENWNGGASTRVWKIISLHRVAWFSTAQATKNSILKLSYRILHCYFVVFLIFSQGHGTSPIGLGSKNRDILNNTLTHILIRLRHCANEYPVCLNWGWLSWAEQH